MTDITDKLSKQTIPIIDPHIKLFDSAEVQEIDNELQKLTVIIRNAYTDCFGKAADISPLMMLHRLETELELLYKQSLQLPEKEIIEKVENGYSRYFLNFDFSLFDEVSSEENGNFLVFNKPKLTSENSFYYYPSKIRYALNHSEKIEEEELLLLFEIRTNDSAIDAIILNTIFDAAMKLTIIFPFVEDSLILSLELRYQTFCEKLVKYIINSEMMSM